MSRLAIKGHKTSGRFVISLLKMMGGKDSVIPCVGTSDGFYYFIDSDGIIKAQLDCDKAKKGFKRYTYGEFVENFPCKVGDEVKLGVLDKIRIANAYWDSCSDQVIYEGFSVFDGEEYDCLNASQLYPCEERVSPDKAKAPALEGQDYSEGRCSYKIPKGFELDKVEDGGIILKPKKREFPKTYEECCEVLNTHCTMPSRPGYKEALIVRFQELLICRDAYWKLADDWKFKIGGNSQEVVYAITIWGNGILKDFYHALNCNRILVFPTEEMRDTFYENFEDLIKECMELL